MEPVGSMPHLQGPPIIPIIPFTEEENPGKPQLGDRQMKTV